MSQLKNEIAEKELIKKFRHDHSWLSDLTPKNKWVGNDVIKIPKQGDAPSVLINNGIYPIAVNNREDDHIVISLNKYETENTSISDDEAETLPYEKFSDVQVQHREELEDVSAEHALYSISPAGDSATTPVLVTTGDDDGTGRKRLTTKDLARYKKQMQDLGIRRNLSIALSTEHAMDLLVEDEARAKVWGSDWSDGKVPQEHAGFRLWCPGYSTNYDAATKARQGFGAATGVPASIIYHRKTCYKATGSAKRYLSKAETDTRNRQTEVGYRIYFIAVSVKNEGQGAIISGTV